MKIDKLSQKIEQFHNLSLTETFPCYVGTNETNLSAIKTQLKNLPLSVHCCYIGVSGWYNFDMMVIRRIDRAVIFDINPHQVIFMKQTLNMIKDNDDICDFLLCMKEFLRSKHEMRVNNISNKKYPRICNELCLQFNVSDDIEYISSRTSDNTEYEIIGYAEILRELKRENSWLNNYNFIRQLALDDKIAIICEDICNIISLTKIISLLHENCYEIDTVYLSNISDWIGSATCGATTECANHLKYQNIKDYFKSIAKIIISCDRDNLVQELTLSPNLNKIHLDKTK